MKTGTRLLVPATVLPLVLLLLAQIINVNADPTSAPITASSQLNDSLVPEWWERISDSFTGINLQMCMMRQSVPPLNGENCGVFKKTCFFGSKACPSVGVSPETQCFCDGLVGNQVWTCMNEPCPSEVTTTSPVTAAPATPAPITSSPSARPLGSISGSVREDLDNDGSGDVEIANVVITLLDERSIVVGTTLTDSSGNYGFTDVPTGNYVVVQTNPASDGSDGVTAPIATSAAPVSTAPINSTATGAPASIAPIEIEGPIAPTTLSPATVAPATIAPATEAPAISSPTASESPKAPSAPATRSPIALTISPVAVGSLATPAPATEAPNTATMAATTPVAMSTVPIWWDRISSTFDGINLKMCLGRQSDPPVSGDACSAIPKTCFFGDKQCPEPSPVLRCYCDGAAGDQIWRCDIEPCPSDATSNPVATTTASPATVAPIALTGAPATRAPTTGAPIVVTVAPVTIAPSTALPTDGPVTRPPITIAPATNGPVTSLVDTPAPTYIPEGTEPLWWERISATFVGVHLRMCEKRMMTPPVDGELCSIAPKTCFFGTKDCPEIGASPVKRCFCPGQNAGQMWQCTDEVCPSSVTSQPSSSPITATVTGSPETAAPMSASPVLFSKDDVTTDRPSVSPSSTPTASQSNLPPTNAPSPKPTRSPIRASSPPTKSNEADGSLPEWWQLISSMPGVVNLGRCEKRSKPPSDGLACGLTRKTCFFGTKQCVEVGAFPTTRCFCDGNSGEQIWRCEDETCPGEITDAPTGIPSDSPSSAPTIAVVGSIAPSSTISESALEDRTAAPSDSPTSAVVVKSEAPTEAPLTEAPVQPSKAPIVPTEAPVQPTKAPVQPTEAPVVPTKPTAASVLPTGTPGQTTEVDVSTTFPTAQSGTPSGAPSSEVPTPDPTYNPTELPTGFPTSAPTSQPGTPTTDPTDVPTPCPTYNPTELPTGFPTSAPTSQPGTPTTDPTDVPTNFPTSAPILQTGTPTADSTDVPTDFPTNTPTDIPVGATVRGNVTEDVDNNGTGDVPISNVVVTLCDRNNPSDCVSSATNSDGLFRFENVSSPAEYCVIETNLGDYIDVSDAIGDNVDEIDSGFDLPNIVCFVLNAGDVGVSDIEFVDRLPSE